MDQGDTFEHHETEQRSDGPTEEKALDASMKALVSADALAQAVAFQQQNNANVFHFDVDDLPNYEPVKPVPFARLVFAFVYNKSPGVEKQEIANNGEQYDKENEFKPEGTLGDDACAVPDDDDFHCSASVVQSGIHHKQEDDNEAAVVPASGNGKLKADPVDVQLIITLFGVDGSRLIHARQTVKSHPLRTVADLVTSIPSLECIQSHAPAGFNVTKVLVFDNERDQFVDAHLDELVFQDATYQFDIQATAQASGSGNNGHDLRQTQKHKNSGFAVAAAAPPEKSVKRLAGNDSLDVVTTSRKRKFSAAKAVNAPHAGAPLERVAFPDLKKAILAGKQDDFQLPDRIARGRAYVLQPTSSGKRTRRGSANSSQKRSVADNATYVLTIVRTGRNSRHRRSSSAFNSSRVGRRTSTVGLGNSKH